MSGEASASRIIIELPPGLPPGAIAALGQVAAEAVDGRVIDQAPELEPPRFVTLTDFATAARELHPGYAEGRAESVGTRAWNQLASSFMKNRPNTDNTGLNFFGEDDGAGALLRLNIESLRSFVTRIQERVRDGVPLESAIASIAPLRFSRGLFLVCQKVVENNPEQE